MLSTETPLERPSLDSLGPNELKSSAVLPPLDRQYLEDRSKQFRKKKRGRKERGAASHSINHQEDTEEAREAERRQSNFRDVASGEKQNVQIGGGVTKTGQGHDTSNRSEEREDTFRDLFEFKLQQEEEVLVDLGSRTSDTVARRDHSQPAIPGGAADRDTTVCEVLMSAMTPRQDEPQVQEGKEMGSDQDIHKLRIEPTDSAGSQYMMGLFQAREKSQQRKLDSLNCSRATEEREQISGVSTYTRDQEASSSHSSSPPRAGSVRRNFFTRGTGTQVSPDVTPTTASEGEGTGVTNGISPRTQGVSPGSWKNFGFKLNRSVQRGRVVPTAGPVNQQSVDAPESQVRLPHPHETENNKANNTSTSGMESTPSQRVRSLSPQARIGTGVKQMWQRGARNRDQNPPGTENDPRSDEDTRKSFVDRIALPSRRAKWWPTSGDVSASDSDEEGDKSIGNDEELSKDNKKSPGDSSDVIRLPSKPGAGGEVSSGRIEGPSAEQQGYPTTVGEAMGRALERLSSTPPAGVWPEPLNNEADPKEWSLDGSDEEVLQAARRKGSVLVRVVTWNLQAKPTASAEELREVLLPAGFYHIYGIGTEECENSIAKSVIIQSKKNWERLLRETFGPAYEMLCGHSLQATHNAIFVHRGILPLIRRVRSAAVATGIDFGLGFASRGTTLGNKGGIGIAFNLGATACVFVNSHFAAHQNNSRERNQNFRQIDNRLAAALRPHRARPASPPPPLTPGPTPNPDGGDPLIPTTTTAAKGGPQSRRVPVDADTSAAAVTAPVSGETDPPHSNKSLSMPLKPGCPSAPSGGGNEDRGDPAPQGPAGAVCPADKGTGTVADPLQWQGVQGDGRPSGSSIGLEDPVAKSSDSRASDAWGPTAKEGGGGEGGGLPPASLLEVFDRVVWAGDLNYRVSAPREVVDQLLEGNMHGALMANDQLIMATGSGEAFTGYLEGPLSFRPTYKFNPGSDVYDTSAKQRVPSWTDRVLYGGGKSKVAGNNPSMVSGGVGHGVKLGGTVGEGGAVAAAAELGTGGAHGAFMAGEGKGVPEDKGEADIEVECQTETALCNGHLAGDGDREKGVTAPSDKQVQTGLELRAYRSVMQLRSSDHRPVLASFIMSFEGKEEGSSDDDLLVTNQTVSQVCVVM